MLCTSKNVNSELCGKSSPQDESESSGVIGWTIIVIVLGIMVTIALVLKRRKNMIEDSKKERILVEDIVAQNPDYYEL